MAVQVVPVAERVLRKRIKVFLITFIIFLGEGQVLAETINIYVGDDTLAPYDFKIETPILGAVNPVLYGYLLHSNSLNELAPGLITEWAYEFKEKKFVLTLGDFQFHNGRSIGADDLEFSIVRGFISDAQNYSRIHFSDIKGITKLKVGMKYHAGLVPGIRVISKQKIEIELENPNPNFLINFTIPFVPLVPREELGENYYAWKHQPIGAGPYKIEKDYADHRLVLKGVQSQKGRPNYIIFDTQRKQELYDIVFDRVVASPSEQKHHNQFSQNPVSINSIFFYRDKPANQNVHFRKAIYHAIDRDVLTEKSDQFKPAYEMLVRPYGGRIAPHNPYSLELAMSEVKKIPREIISKEYIVGVYSPNSVFSPLMAVRINKMSEMFKKIGLKIRFEPNPEKFPTPEVMKKFDMKLWSKVVDLADPVISYGAMSSLSPYANEIPSSGGKFDTIYESAIAAKTTEERLEKLQNISKLIEEEALIVPILQKYVLYRIDSSKIKSLGEQPKPLFLDLSRVELQ